jgi:hypothetical protein
MKRPVLKEVTLADWLWAIGEPYPVSCLINEGVWTDIANKSYQQGGVVIEIGANHKPVRAFHKGVST